jgi:hypothetical protein
MTARVMTSEFNATAHALVFISAEFIHLFGHYSLVPVSNRDMLHTEVTDNLNELQLIQGTQRTSENVTDAL